MARGKDKNKEQEQNKGATEGMSRPAAEAVYAFFHRDA